MNMHKVAFGAFRAWHKKEKKMYYLATPEDVGKPYDSMPYLRLYAGGGWELVSSKGKILVNDATGELMAFTGRKDRKELEIYDGDVLAFPHYKALVECEPGGFAVRVIDSIAVRPLWIVRTHEWAEIVGNRFENPELLVEEVR